jgi:hypothetical protein
VRVPPQDSRGLPGGRPPKIASPKVFAQGEHDPHRLTVHGLSYLQNLDRERDT